MRLHISEVLTQYTRNFTFLEHGLPDLKFRVSGVLNVTVLCFENIWCILAMLLRLSRKQLYQLKKNEADK